MENPMLQGIFFSFGKKNPERKARVWAILFFFLVFFPPIGEGQTLTEFQMANNSCPTTDLWVPSCPID